MQIVSNGDNLHEMSKSVFLLSRLEIICIKYQILFSGKNKKNMINILSTEFAQIEKIRFEYACKSQTLITQTATWVKQNFG